MTHPIIRLFFDLTINGGWNLVAITTYAMIAAVVLTAFLEARKSE